jgi:serine/threonine protein kinase
VSAALNAVSKPAAGGIAAVRHIGRFRLLRELGRGAQATVWLAHDPRLDREVALKLFHPAADAHAVSDWLHEAHAVSRLTHPHIVPVFEAGEAAGPPYLVFEFVAGPTLAEARRQRPQWPPREAVTLMLDVLDGLAAAHAQGIVHRDLKPSNVLLGADGRARVMDFGIAARMTGSAGGPGHDSARAKAPADATAGCIVGTPGYISPEAARGEPPLPTMDVFAAGAMLAELLAGEALLQETDPWRAVQRVQQEDLVLPSTAPVDEALRSIVQRALGRDTGLRYDSASALHKVLAAWLQQTAETDDDASAEAAAGHATLQFLLRRMRHKTDFPALSAQVARILRLTSSETESLNRLAEEIMQDVGLTHKLLRMVNAAHFTGAAGGGIGTVSRAVALVGVAGIRNLVLSALLLEHMGDKAHAVRIQQEFLRALMAGSLARELTPLARESEEAFLVGMLRNLGRLLTEYYFPEEALQIQRQVPAGEGGMRGLEAAAQRVLGIGFDELTAGVARAWGLPVRLQRALAAPEATAPAAAAGPGSGAEAAVERLRRLGHSANELTDLLLASDADTQAQPLAAAAAQHAALLGCSADTVVAAAHGARVRLRQMVQALGLKGLNQAAAKRLLGAATAPARAAAVVPQPTATRVRPGGAPAGAAVRPRLEHGLQEVQRASASRTQGRNELLHLVLETIRRALDLRCAVLCLREAGSSQLTGRIGLGAGAGEARTAFRVVIEGAAPSDLFAALCAKGADLLVADAAKLSSRLPAWYRRQVNAPTFLLLPMVHEGAAVGLIYGDKLESGSLVLADGDLALLRALRDHAVAALRRA